MKIKYLFLISSVSNVLTYFLVYLFIRIAFFPKHLENFMKFYSIIYVIFFVAGMISSYLTKEKIGSLQHFRYIKNELMVVVIFIFLYEIFSNNPLFFH